jgi:hypothetical protein
MSSGNIEAKEMKHESTNPEIATKQHETHSGPKVSIDHNEIVVDPDLMTDAVDGENRVHKMGTVGGNQEASLGVFFCIHHVLYHCESNLGHTRETTSS